MMKVAATVALLFALVAVSLLRSSEASVLPGGQHWAHTQPEVRIGIEYGPGVDPVKLANAAANWSVSPYVEIGVVGPVSDTAACSDIIPPSVYKLGIIVACVWPQMTWAQGTVWFIDECQVYPSPTCDPAHLVTVGVYSATDNEFTYCHELGHALGLDHETGDTCMNSFWYEACPGSADFASLSEVYGGHTDSWDSAVPAIWAPGAAWCIGEWTPTPTPPPPTPCISPNPKSKKCK